MRRSIIYILSTIDTTVKYSFVCVLLLILLVSGCSREIVSSRCAAPIFEVSIDDIQSINAYIVKQGDSLYKIAKIYGIDVDSLKKVNNIDNSCQVIAGSLLYIPIVGNSCDEYIASSNEAIQNKVFTSKSNTYSSDCAIIWEWPCNGLIKEHFSLKNRGIDICGSIGDSVLAAASGKVVYSGGGVRGLGKLLILSHDEGFITAYAHNSKLFVYNGQDVKKGHKIAEVGDSDSDIPKLHFEIRKNGLPVDPLRYLPKK